MRPDGSEERRWVELLCVYLYFHLDMDRWARDVQLSSVGHASEETCTILMSNEPDLKATNIECAEMVRFEALTADSLKSGTMFEVPRADGLTPGRAIAGCCSLRASMRCFQGQ